MARPTTPEPLTKDEWTALRERNWTGGKDIHGHSRHGKTLLMAAFDHAEPPLPRVVKKLLALGVDVNATDSKNGQNVLWAMDHVALKRWLPTFLAAGLFLDHRDDEGNSVLDAHLLNVLDWGEGPRGRIPEDVRDSCRCMPVLIAAGIDIDTPAWDGTPRTHIQNEVSAGNPLFSRWAPAALSGAEQATLEAVLPEAEETAGRKAPRRRL
jgi:hypothetical protein